MEAYDEGLMNDYEELIKKIDKLKKFVENCGEFAQEQDIIETNQAFIDQYEEMRGYKNALELRASRKLLNMSDKELMELMEAYSRLLENEEFQREFSSTCDNNSTCFHCRYNSICLFAKLLNTAYREGLDVFKTIENAKKYLECLEGVEKK